MADIYLDNDTFNQAQADMFATNAHRQVANTWASQASAAAPSMVADAQDRANQTAAGQRQQVADDWAQQAQSAAASALQSTQASDGPTQSSPSGSPPPPAQPGPISADLSSSADAGNPASTAATVTPTSPVAAPLVPPPPAQTPQTAQTPSSPTSPVTAPLSNPASTQQPIAPTGSGAPNDANQEAYIRQAAAARGIDPDTAVRVWNGEGRSSYIGDNGSSFGPFQLHYGGVASGGNAVGGLGDAFTAQTGLDARDPSTWQKQVDFTLDQVGRSGWGPWHGAAAQGITGMAGVGNTQSSGAAPTANTQSPDWQTLALSQLNKPYIWGSGSGAGGRGTQDVNASTGQPNGFDCSGYVSWVLQNGMGVNLPAQTASAYAKTTAIDPKDAQPGDVVFYNMDSSDPHLQHEAMYLGDGKIVEAGGINAKVNIADLNANGTPEFRRAAGAQASSAQDRVGQALTSGATTVASNISSGVQSMSDFLGQLGRDPTEQELSSFLSNAKDTAGSALTEFAQNGPIGAFSDNLRGLGSDIGNSGVAQWKAQNFPSILDPNHPINVAADLEQKYGTSVPSDSMTPEDRQRAENAQLAFAGLEGAPGEAYDNFGVALGQPPDALANLKPGVVNAQNAETLANGAQQFEKLPGGVIGPVGQPAAQGGDTLLQGLINEARARGYDTTELEQQLAQSTGAAEPATVTGALDASVPPPGEPPSAPPSTPTGPNPPDGGTQPTLPGLPNPNPPGLADVFRAYHSGNVISGIPTLTHVAVNSILAPAWSFATRGAADIVGGAAGLATGGRVGLDTGFSRVQGSGVGLAAGLASAGNDFASSIADHFSNPELIGNRLGGTGGALLNAQSSFGALHGAFQDMAQGFIQKIELGRLAGQEATAQGLKGSDWTSFVGDAINNPGGQMLQQAQAVAKRAALRGDPGTLGTAMQQIARVPFLGNTLFPVVRIASNSLAQGIEKSPLGLLGTGFDVARAAAGAGPYATEAGFAGNGIVSPLSERLTNNIAGSALTAWLASKALDGSITGAGPSDPRQRALLQAQGWQPNSVYIPGRGYVDYHALGSQGLAFGLAGAFGDSMKYNRTQDAPGFAGEIARQVGTYLTNATGLRTIADLYATLSGTGTQAAGAQFAGNLAGGFVPESAALRSVVGAFDPSMRQVEPGNVQQVIQQGLPGGTPLIGGRQDLPVKQDVLGRPEANPEAGMGILSPRTGAGTPSAAALVLGQSGVTLAAPPKTLSVAGQPVPLTPDEQQLYERARGQVLDQLAPHLLDNASFQAAPSATRVKVLQQQIAQADQVATARTLAAIGGPAISQRIGGAVPVARPNLSLPTASATASSTAGPTSPSQRDQIETLRQQLIANPQFADTTPDQQDQIIQQVLAAQR